MNRAPLTVILAVGWVAITGSLSLLNLAFGLLIAALVTFILRDRLAQRSGLRRLAAAFRLALLLLWQLLLSALGVARLVVDPTLARRLKPAIINYPLQVKSDGEITLLANLITLTPGTLTVDVSPDRQRLFIHVLSLDDQEACVASIRSGFERRVMDIFL